MKKYATICIIAIMIALLTFAGCATTTNASSVTSSGSSSSQKIFTAAELKKYNGQNGNPAYVAVDGKVYDVTNAKNWNNGMHQGLSAGQDLSKQIKSAPHGTSVLDGLTVVGKLQ